MRHYCVSLGSRGTLIAIERRSREVRGHQLTLLSKRDILVHAWQIQRFGYEPSRFAGKPDIRGGYRISYRGLGNC